MKSGLRSAYRKTTPSKYFRRAALETRCTQLAVQDRVGTAVHATLAARPEVGVRQEHWRRLISPAYRYRPAVL
jgi:hypothetical protein